MLSAGWVACVSSCGQQWHVDFSFYILRFVSNCYTSFPSVVMQAWHSALPVFFPRAGGRGLHGRSVHFSTPLPRLWWAVYFSEGGCLLCMSLFPGRD